MFKTTRKICVDTVVGEGKAQVFSENTFVLPKPAVELLRPIVNVRFDNFVPLRNKVIVQGRIKKNIIFKAMDGNVSHAPEEFSFRTEVEVPGFNPTVIRKGCLISNQNTFKTIVEEIFVNETLLDPTTIEQKVVLRFFLKVLRQEEIRVPIKCNQVFHIKSKISCDC